MIASLLLLGRGARELFKKIQYKNTRCVFLFIHTVGLFLSITGAGLYREVNYLEPVDSISWEPLIIVFTVISCLKELELYMSTVRVVGGRGRITHLWV